MQMRCLSVLCLVWVSTLLAACGGSSPSEPSPSCTFTVGEGPAGSVAAAGTEFTVSVSAAAGCSWTASSNSAFITPSGSTTGSGNGTARFTVQPNGGAARQGSVLVASKTIQVSQTGATGCEFTVNPTQANVAAAGADVAVDVTVASGTNCAWTATSGSAFVTVKEGATGSGNGRAVLTVGANTADARVGSATVAGRAVSLVQESGLSGTLPCEFVVTPPQFDVPASGLTGGVVTITKTQGGTCPWVARTTQPWITLRNTTGEGTGTVTFDVAPNFGGQRSQQIDFSANPNGPHTTVVQAAAPVATPVAIVSYTSDPGDFVGGGMSDSVTANGSAFQATLDAPQSTLELTIPGGSNYRVVFRSPSGPLASGTYINAARYPFQPAGAPGLSFTGNANGCNRLTGRFLIQTAVFSGVQVQRFHARFEQHCEGWSAALRGQVWIDAGGAPPPALANFPPAPASPVTTLSYVSDAGDFIGSGQSATLTLGGLKAIAWAGESDPSVRITIQTASGPPTVSWHLDFEGTSGTRLMPGTYNNATRYPFNAAGVPGLSVTGNGRGCNTVTGSFVVHEVEYGPQGEVLRFHATFEQHCEGAVPALRGEIRIAADPWR